MEITKLEHMKWEAEQVGQICKKHGTKIMMGDYGLWCGKKDEFGVWCSGNPYPKPEGESLTIKAE